MNLTVLAEKYPEAVRLQYVYGIALRLDNLGISSKAFDQFLYKSYDSFNKWRVAQALAKTGASSSTAAATTEGGEAKTTVVDPE